jgi:hypothetical protein
LLPFVVTEAVHSKFLIYNKTAVKQHSVISVPSRESVRDS